MNDLKSMQNSFNESYGSFSLPVFLFDRNGKLLNANRSFLSLTGIKKSSLSKHPVMSFITKLFKDGSWAFKMIPENHTAEITGSKDRLIPVIINYNKFYTSDGSGEGALGFIIDLTEIKSADKTIKRMSAEYEALKDQLAGKKIDSDLIKKKQLEQDARNAKDFLENVIESCGDGIAITDSTGRFTRANEHFAAMLSRTREEIEGKYIYEFTPPAGTFLSTSKDEVILDKEYIDGQINTMLNFLSPENSDEVLSWQWYAFRKSGDIVPLESTATVQRDADGVLTGIVLSVRDITKRKIAEKALKKANEFERRFFTNITHEFRTPITLAIGPIEGVLRDEFGKTDKKTKEQLAISLKNSRQLLKLVNQLLDFSRLQSGAKHVVREERDLSRFISNILDSFSVIAKNKKIKLSFNPPKDFKTISFDPGKIEKVLFNLIGNAFKFTPEKGSITITAELTDKKVLSSKEFKNTLKITVSDTGIGIKENETKNIFERFSQAEASRFNEEKGTGIGLSHAKELVELMNGKITVKSTYGKGSSFSVYLPINVISKTKKTDGSNYELLIEPEIELSDIRQSSISVKEKLTGKKPLVLIIDDNPDLRSYVSATIESKYDFITAANGKEGLKQLEKHLPDIILCDVMMPEMDGHEFLAQVKTDPALKSIPFIFLTARASIEMKIEGLEEGADDYIVKPFNSLELLARIKSLLRIRDLLIRSEAQEKKITVLTRKLQGRFSFGNIIGSSPSMLKIYQLIETIKDSDSSVLITGETGSGKELISNAIHYNSPRKDGPLISVNCGAIPKELMEREFFGNVKGAYTGADKDRKGYFEEAHKGTLFLDEIGEMDLDMQVKLLRVLEKGEVTPVGAAVPVKTAVRMIAATNKDLLAEVQKGNFREDLYYRIFVIPVHVPPLRQRQEDIPLLINFFISDFNQRTGKKTKAPEKKDLQFFMDYSYPGNIRELKHIIERYCLLGSSPESLFDRSDKEIQNNQTFLNEEILSSSKPLKEAARIGRSQAEKEVLLHTLKECANDYPKTAAKLNICLASLYNKLNEYNIKS